MIMSLLAIVSRIRRLFLLSLVGLTASVAGSASADDRPNILLMVSDDQRVDSVAVYGEEPRAESPNLDALAASGVLFTRAYTNSPVCAPSRRSYLAGKYPHRTGVYDFAPNHNEVDWFTEDFPIILHQHGYQTAMFGKEGGSAIRRNAQGQWRRTTAFRDAYGQVAQFRFHGMSAIVRNPGTNRFNPPINPDDPQHNILRAHPRKSNLIVGGYNPRPKGEHEDDYFVKGMEAWFKGSRFDNKRPAFVKLGFVFPHTPVLPPKDIAQRFEAKDFPIPEVDPQEVAAFVPQMARLQRMMNADYPPHEMKQYIAHYFADCAYGDEVVGRAIAAFKARSEEMGRPWIIVFTSDHGLHMGEHGFSTKWTFYDDSVRVPMIAASSDPSVFTPGQRVEDIVELVDLAPTILEAAGLDLTDYPHLDGRSLRATAAGEHEPREFALHEIGHIHGYRAGLRSKDWAFSMRTRPDNPRLGRNMRWATHMTDPRRLEMQLFDLNADPGEHRNLADDPAYAEQVERLKAELIKRVLGDDRREYNWKADHQKYWGTPHEAWMNHLWPFATD